MTLFDELMRAGYDEVGRFEWLEALRDRSTDLAFGTFTPRVEELVESALVDPAHVCNLHLAGRRIRVWLPKRIPMSLRD